MLEWLKNVMLILNMAEGKKTTVVSGQFRRSFGHPSKSTLIIILVLLALITAGSLFIWSQRNNNNEPIESVGVCSVEGSEMFEKALSAYNPYDEADIATKAPLVEEITQTEGYENDANCLYPVTMYYVTTGDPENAKKYAEKLKQVYKEPEDISWQFVYHATNEEIADNIDFLEKQRDESINQSLYFEIPPEIEEADQDE